MSSFNWFRRGYDESSKAEAETTDESTPEATSTETTTDDAPANAEDYLAWAKAAYQNIQQQQVEASAPESESAPEPEPEPEPESEPEPPAAPTATPAAEDVPTSVSTAEEVSTPVLTTEEAPAATDSPEASPSIAAPFWAKAAEAEREARLAKLKETAIVEPEPEPQPESEPEPELVMPDVDLDEAFLWSAEVLASQGRRPDDISLEEITWLNQLRQGLGKTRRGLVNQLKSVVGQGPLNEDAIYEIEALLLQADVGVEATDKIIEALQSRMREETLPPDAAIRYLKNILRKMLDSPLDGDHNLLFVPESEQLNIWLMVGVNGAGKTTTIGKLTHIAQKSGYNCLIAAADTFRAAAVEQVKVWGARSGVEVISNPGQNTDPAAVVFDAIAAANSRNTELLLVDTAGRLQNKKNLMDELSKVRRIIDKKAPDANVEALLVLDATLGQNGVRQAKVFSEAANLSGVVLTKLDGTAKGGVALAVVQQLGLPIRFIGAGEGIEDLRPFSSYEFVEALLSG
ncbi:signal recognition particle-docking protein [Leptolyngbya sp. Heron Island J]|uniref:signal recognition particle-docking protein FtsY n=1 Tax=Leptolyngbya sp. Heron Island J TaxID=1385935 RepID=UPI0003B9E307|nr:signal recognition particle-docking protein FtsY [Leptolyngbya sp. Heron Island J]ESA39069.1 signal recognition particle-docking protein [Leptolyngbya sp. Heron Island J]